MFILVSQTSRMCLWHHIKGISLTSQQTKIADLVQIVPEDFNKDAAQAIEDNINAKYANKVIQKIGLCICLYDLLSSSEGLIGHGTGLVNVNGTLRAVLTLSQVACLLLVLYSYLLLPELMFDILLLPVLQFFSNISLLPLYSDHESIYLFNFLLHMSISAQRFLQK